MIRTSSLSTLAVILLGTTALPASAIAADRSAAPPTPQGVVQVAQSEAVAAIQERLNRLGYNAGPQDGMMGPRTRSAIEEYQNDYGLLVTGEPSQSLLDHITSAVEDQMDEEEEEDEPEAAPDTDADVISAIQSELRNRDYAIPAVTGELDSTTREAIRAYERDRGYLVTGRPSAELLEDMRADRDDDAAERATRQEIARVQTELNERGYDAGPADGVMGPRTRTAIRTYQSDAGMELSGRITPELLAQLEVEETDEAPEEPEETDDPDLATLLADDFSDGDYTSDPRWEIADGSFAVRDGGLTSSVAEPRAQTLEDAGLQILGSVLERELGIRVPGPEQPGVAAAYVPVSVPDTFHIRADIIGRGITDGQINIGPYIGNQPGHGYRLAYLAGEAQPLVLLRITGGDQAVLDSSSLTLSDGQTLAIDWERQADGSMTVVANGDVVLQATDTALSGGFSGFSLINAGGDWTLGSVTVQGPES
jgi:peptidoglycan hydrolase-like protein with peptidoglycan-binding domain